MTVTELAIIPLAHPLSKEAPGFPPGLVGKLLRAKSVLETVSRHSFYYFQQVEDPSIMYIIGTWDSVEAHRKFLISHENRDLLNLLKDDIVIGEGEGKGMQMYHLSTSILLTSPYSKAVTIAPTIALGQHFVSTTKRDAFEQKFSEVKHLLEDFTKPYQLTGGWRIEKENEDKDEWALFSGWESVEQHMSFARTDEFGKYKEIVGLVNDFEVRHMRPIEGL